MHFSIIIPVYNEARILAENLAYLRSLLPPEAEVIVVDGGSQDGSRDIAGRYTVAQVLTSPQRGRSLQMNQGAAQASGEVLLFLHADARLPFTWATEIEQARQQGYAWGAFRITCGGRENLNLWQRFFAWVTTWRSHYTRRPYGDQAIFATREAFTRVGGYPEIPIMEDYELSRRLSGLGRPYPARSRVDVSYRRFRANLLLATWQMIGIPFLYKLGVAPRRLARWYKPLR